MLQILDESNAGRDLEIMVEEDDDITNAFAGQYIKSTSLLTKKEEE
jgi:hypothetical protein